MNKIFIWIMALVMVTMFNLSAIAQDDCADCCGDLEACEQLLDEVGLNEGEASVGDIFDLIPAYRKLPTKTKWAITSILTIALGVLVMYIPPPEGP